VEMTVMAFSTEQQVNCCTPPSDGRGNIQNEAFLKRNDGCFKADFGYNIILDILLFRISKLKLKRSFHKSA